MAATPAFRGRARECEALDQLLAVVRAGASSVLVIRGEAGIGKTSLLQYCRRRAAGCRVTEIAAVESEMELPFAALHQLCTPMLGELDSLPEPQAHAVRVAFGLSVGITPNPFMIGLAVLGLLAESSAKEPLVWLIDDAQWLDEATSQVLGFVGRRLLAEPVALIFASRESGETSALSPLPRLTLEGLDPHNARALLTAGIPRQLDEEVRDRIIAETRGNPLALLELPKGMGPGELAGGFGVPTSGTLTRHMEDHYVQRILSLPERTQQLMVVAAADPTGSAILVWQAARALGIARDAAGPAAEAELLEIGSSVRFRHPLVRSAAYAAASVDARVAAHRALAQATDAESDPDRRAWHLATATIEPDEAVAAELERTAGRAHARGGLAAVAAFLQRSMELTAEPARRAERALTAATAHLDAGSCQAGLDLLADAEATGLDDKQRARVQHLRGQIEVAHREPRSPSRIRRIAVELEPIDRDLARQTHLLAWAASFVAGPFAEEGSHLRDVSAAALAAPRNPGSPQTSDLLLEGLSTLTIDGLAAAAPTLRLSIGAFAEGRVAQDDWIRWGTIAQMAAASMRDIDGWLAVSTRQVAIARAAGALTILESALAMYGMVAAWCGDFESASSVIAEEAAVKEVTGISRPSGGAPVLSAYQGGAAARRTMRATESDARVRGEGFRWQMAKWAMAVIHNGEGRYAQALDAADQAADVRGQIITVWALPELIEAAARTGNLVRAEEALQRLADETSIDGGWGRGTEARSRALLSAGEHAERYYAEAIEQFARTPLQPELARSHLVYGEWLRRENRRVDAREQLHLALDMFETMGVDAFVDRARRELLATGENVRRRDGSTRRNLTSQEGHIARLACRGRANHEIAAELFISARTVEWHLRNVFTKLGITTRRDLAEALSADRDQTTASG